MIDLSSVIINIDAFASLRMIFFVSGVGVADMLAAREDATIVEKVCSSQARQNTRTSLNKVIIGSVPDRGGRTETMQVGWE